MYIYINNGRHDRQLISTVLTFQIFRNLRGPIVLDVDSTTTQHTYVDIALTCALQILLNVLNERTNVADLRRLYN